MCRQVVRIVAQHTLKTGHVPDRIDSVSAVFLTRSARASVVANGADGMHSIVRENAGIDFDGAQYAHSFVLADVKMDWKTGHEEVFLFFTVHGPLVVAAKWQFPKRRRHRECARASRRDLYSEGHRRLWSDQR
jgi:2-polyprenyl-6-methoxyphenol hydroxylase-like FAD-dependent oxidoreductase